MGTFSNRVRLNKVLRLSKGQLCLLFENLPTARRRLTDAR